MVLTMLEARVAAERVSDLERAYREVIAELPPEIVETLLTRDARDPAVFRILTLWQSHEALEKMRASGVRPRGIQIFEAAGATPALSILDVMERGSHR
jgi:hypothetical protein